MTAPDPGPVELAQKLLDLCMIELVESTGGDPARGYLHPGGKVPPDYLGDNAGCDYASVRIVDLNPQPGTWSRPCAPSIYQMVVEIKVMRCYPDRDPRMMPDPAVLAAATRVALDDAAAVRRALCAFPSPARVEVGRWRPEGPDGGAYSGITTATFYDMDLPCC